MASPLPEAPIAPRLALLSIGGFWAFYLGINTLRAFVSEVPEQVDMLLRRLVVTLFGIGLTCLLYLLLRRRQDTGLPAMVATVFLASVPLAFAYAAFNYLIFHSIYPSPVLLAKEAELFPDVEPWLVIADQAVEWYSFIVAWGVLYLAMAYAGQVRAAERQAARYRAAAQAAELRALRYQVNPHFLFNTLNSLSALVLAGHSQAAERMILNLATFFRTSLGSEAAGDVPLADEIAMQRLYLDIEQVRFPARLHVEIDVPEALATVPVPALILQPLVENAIKHGVARSRRPVTIRITARTVGDSLELRIVDDGEGLGAPAAGTGTGVRNVCDRLAARFGAQARCDHDPQPGGGYLVTLVLPREAGLVTAG